MTNAGYITIAIVLIGLAFVLLDIVVKSDDWDGMA